MLPSEELRKDIAKKYNVDLEQYAWPEQLRNIIFSIPLDECLEENAKNLGENIGFVEEERMLHFLWK